MDALLLILLVAGILATPFVTNVLVSSGKKVWGVLTAAPLLILASYFAFFASFEREAAWGIFFAIPIWAMAALTVLGFVIGLRRYRANLASGQMGLTE